IMGPSTRGAFEEAIRWGCEGLRALGIEVPEKNLGSAVLALMSEVKIALEGRSMDDLLGFGEVRDPGVAAGLVLLAEMLPASWHHGPELFAFCNLQTVLLSLRHGNGPTSAAGFIAYGVMLAQQGEYETAYAVARMALQLVRRFGHPAEESKV